ncbi:VCBS repeat-containing protein [Winogradskyella sp. PG-2]|uniref:VCBS repeat-containing protein n=1 Tax=Winogradskyella sp. PG-2 TaxID=754409 RepID=UPI0004586476|nr:VCBS repeat-containing protein [Winogradskyella sp. PG-2]BAO75017.1 hypothetical protein WPG_0787 [Winogradskyella sp. PG-2]
MKHPRIQFLVIFFICCSFFTCNDKPSRDLNPKELIGGFELLSSEKTGIDFNNSIKESTTVNHIYYNQIYSGAGVAIGDINNDGLSDVFFGGNQVSDRLYLNKGNFTFENITKKSRVAKNSGWTWGVTMVDINADGYLDIYISRNGESMKPEERRNQLYINNQDLTFTESAQKYGLADVGFSSEAVFFDMDNDGDLDMYQVNQLPDSRLFRRYKIPQKRQKYYTDKLYLNVNGKYKDVSESAGISRSLTYGLSASVSDFNNDGWMDLYVSNDYDEPDFMYYNNGDGTFKNVINEKLKHISRFSMGTDAGDLNNDGLMDIITLDMSAEDHYRSKTNMGSMSREAFNKLVNSGKHYQYMNNTLQVNSGVGHFYDVATMNGIAQTDWSWSGLLADLDNDGLKDIMITNGIKKDVRNNDFLTVLYKELETDSKDFFEMSKKAPSKPIANYVYKNKGNLEFEKMTEDWGFNTPSFSSGMAYGDLDNDGDLDVVINNMESEAFVYKNKSNGNYLKVQFEGSEENTFGFGAKVTIRHNEKMQLAQNTVTRGYLSSVEPGLFFGLGKDKNIEKVEVVWPDGKINRFTNVKANTTLIAKYGESIVSDTSTKRESLPLLDNLDSEDLGIDFVHKENIFDDFEDEILLPHKLSENGPFLTAGDVNADGFEDVFLGGASGQSGTLYLQNQEGQFIKNESQPWEADKASEDLQSLFLDVDNDNDLDLYVTSGGNQFKLGHPSLYDRLYLNNGKGNFFKAINALPEIAQSSQCVQPSDVDNDGDLDLFIGTRLIPGKYTYPATSYILINENGMFKKAPLQTRKALENIGMVTDAVFTDIDNDNDEDLMIVGEWMEIKIFHNQDGVFEDQTGSYNLGNTRGIWWSISANDIDNDGDDDYIIGNLGNNNKFKASKAHPFKVYANDFDNNGTNDIVLAKFYKDDYVPLRGRECTSQQMPYVAEKFEDYHSFASSTLIDILPEDKVNDAIIYEIESFESIALMNDNGKLKIKPLPVEAQIAPLKSSFIYDINKDGFKDIITVGNHYGVEVETTRYDAGYGAIFLGNENNNFKFLSPNESGFDVPYDSRDLKFINQSDRPLLIITNNNAKPSVFRVKG